MSCVPGNENGPYHNECKVFDYDYCSSTDCENYKRCDNCLTQKECGWCEYGQYCFTSTNEDTANCPNTFYYNSEVEGKNKCPAKNNFLKKKYEKDISEQISNKINEELEEWRAYASDLQNQINSLENLKQAILQTATKGLLTDANEIRVENDSDNLSETVDELYNAEVTQSQAYQENLASKSSDKIIDSIEYDVKYRTNIVTYELNDYETDVTYDLEASKQSLTDQLDELEQEIYELTEEFNLSRLESETTESSAEEESSETTETTEVMTEETTEDAEV